VNSSSSQRWAWLALTVLTLLMLVPGTGTLPLLDRDEPRFAQATVEMIQRGDWIVPTFNGQERFDKPILTYWLMRAGYTLLGIGEWGARVHSLFATWVVVMVTALAGQRWFGGRVGWWGAAMLATCLQFFLHGRLALADQPMVACVAVACMALGEIVLPSPRLSEHSQRPAWWALYVALGLGFLAKGPVALAVPALALLLFRVAFQRSPLPWDRLQPLPGLLLALAIVAAWAVPALLATDGRFFAVGIGEHVVQRGVERFNGRDYKPWFYLATAPVSLFPWFGFVGVLISRLRRPWDPRTAWLTSWLLAPYLIFSVYATQLPHYVLPAFPAFFLLLADGWLTRPPRWASAAGWIFLGLLGITLLLGLGWINYVGLPGEAESLRSALCCGLVLLCGFSLIPLAWTRSRWLSMAGLVGVVVGSLGAAESLRAVSLTREVARLCVNAPPATRKIGFGFAEPGLVFYSQSRWEFLDSERELAAQIARPGPILIVFVRREIDPIRFFLGPVAWHRWETPEVLSQPEWRSEICRGLNLGRTRWQELAVLRRGF